MWCSRAGGARRSGPKSGVSGHALEASEVTLGEVGECEEGGYKTLHYIGMYLGLIALIQFES